MIGGMYNFPIPSWPRLSGTDESMKFDGTNAYAYAKRGQVRGSLASLS